MVVVVGIINAHVDGRTVVRTCAQPPFVLVDVHNSNDQTMVVAVVVVDDDDDDDDME
jgi:hypothetical protein